MMGRLCPERLPVGEEKSFDASAEDVRGSSSFCVGPEAQESRCFRVPPPLCFDSDDHEPAPSGTEKFWVRSFLGFAKTNALDGTWNLGGIYCKYVLQFSG